MGRRLKPRGGVGEDLRREIRGASPAEVWIETIIHIRDIVTEPVASPAEVWIETAPKARALARPVVASHAEARIETRLARGAAQRALSHLPCGGVDRKHEGRAPIGTRPSSFRW